jgi:hypothetical protein
VVLLQGFQMCDPILTLSRSDPMPIPVRGNQGVQGAVYMEL